MTGDRAAAWGWGDGAVGRVVAPMARDAEGAVRHPRLLEQYGYRAQASMRFSTDVEGLSVHKDEHSGRRWRRGGRS